MFWQYWVNQGKAGSEACLCSLCVFSHSPPRDSMLPRAQMARGITCRPLTTMWTRSTSWPRLCSPAESILHSAALSIFRPCGDVRVCWFFYMPLPDIFSVTIPSFDPSFVDFIFRAKLHSHAGPAPLIAFLLAPTPIRHGAAA